MPRRKYKRRIQKETGRNPEKDIISKISPETKKAILVFCLLILGFLSFLALFNLSGKIGQIMLKGMKLIMGWLYFFVPILLLFFGIIFLNPKKYTIHLRHYLGIVLFFLSITGFLNLIISSKDVFKQIAEGRGGGYIGVPFYLAFSKLAGFWGAIVILVGLLIISIFLTFNLNLSHLRIGERIRELLNPKREKIDEDETDETVLKSADQEIENNFDDEVQQKSEDISPDNSNKSNKKSKVLFPTVKKKIYKDIKIPLDLLSDEKDVPISRNIEESKEIIKRTFSNFGIRVEMGEANVGPTVTQFTLKPDENIKLSKIFELQSNLALALAATHPLRIEAPIPGKSLVGIEVPNKVISIVRIKEVLSDKCFTRNEGHLVFALGKDVSGTNHVADLAKMPHLLIAGSTNTGKSVCLNVLIVSLLYRLNPNELKFIMIDMKRVELSPYNGIPHLLTPVITKIDKIVNALKWSVSEMERRLDLLSKVNKVNIFEYNSYVSKIEDRIPQIVIIIDELAELMALAGSEVEKAIIRLAQMGRAVGFHLVLATQRPSVNVITGLIKANITSRIAFSVASNVDSRTILDTSGAEKLFGRGDMLYVSSESSKPRRLQGAFVSGEEKERVIEFLKKQAEPDYLDEVTEFEDRSAGFTSTGGQADSLLEEAKKIVVKHEKASSTLLMRRLSVGYARGAKILDQLEECGFVGPANGPRPRDVLITEEEFMRMGTDISQAHGILPYSQQDDKSYDEDDLDDLSEEKDFDEVLDDEEDIDNEELTENIEEEQDEFEVDDDKTDE